MKLAALVIALAACTDSVSIARDRCGNGIVEPARGEDCDSDEAHGCSGCRVMCGDGAECPDGAACGPGDGLCHRSSGRFVPRDVDARLSVSTFVAGDIDRDGIADIVGIGNGSVVTLSGDVDLPLEIGETKGAPFATAPATIRDINGDDLPDVIIPAQAGIATFETGEDQLSALEPVAFPFEVTADTHVRAGELPIGGGVLHLSKTPTEYHFNSAEHSPVISKRACNINPGMNDSIVGRVMEPFGNGPASMVAAFVVAHPNTYELCVDTITDGAVRNAIPVQAPSQVGNVVIGEFDGASTCPDVAVPKQTVAGPVSAVYRGTATTPCGITPVQIPEVPGAPLTRVRISGNDYLVTTEGLFSPQSPTSPPLLTATRQWTTAISRDFDRNGFVDFAVAGVNEDVEVFQQRAGNEWRIVRIPLASAVIDLAAGDFDGDTYADLALGTLDGSGRGNIYISYGSPSTFTEPTLELYLPERPTDLSSAALEDDSVQMGTDVYDDLVITHGVAPSKLSFIYGSANRHVAAPWRPHDTTDQNTAEGVVVGRFGPGGGPGVVALFADPYKSVTSSFAPAAMTDPCPMLGRQLYRSPETFVFTRFINTCAAKDFTSGARFIAVPFAARDLVLGLNLTTDQSSGSVGADDLCAAYVWPGDDAALATITCATLIDTAAQATAIHAVSDVRLVPDREQTVMLSSRIRDNTHNIVTVMNEWRVAAQELGRPQLVEVVPIEPMIQAAFPVVQAVSCFDVAYVDLGERVRDGVTFGNGLEQLFACHIKVQNRLTIEVFARFRDDKSRSEPGVVEAIAEFPNQDKIDIEVGDVTGDGLADIVVQGDRGAVRILENCDMVCAAETPKTEEGL